MFTKGQTVVVVGSSGSDYQVVTIKNVWKNGVAEIDDGDGHKGTLYNSDGYRRGGGWAAFGRSHIRPLTPSETPESVKAAISAKAATARAESEREAREQAAAEYIWWEEAGKAIWDARIVLPERFLGEVVSIIRYERDNEQHLALVVIRETDGNGQPMPDKIGISGGLLGRDYSKNAKSLTLPERHITAHTCIPGRRGSTTRILYDICH